MQVGVGASVAGINSDLTQGSIQTTGVPTDVSIQGTGYFVVNKGGEALYTRAGNFTVGSEGSLLTQDGAIVQGYQASNGVIQANAALGGLSIPTGLINPPRATTEVQLALNLDASGGLPSVAAAQQTGASIPASATLATGAQLAFNDGTNNFTFTAAAGNTLANLVTAINANPNFTASMSGNNLVITATNGSAIAFTTNSPTDAGTGALSETFSPTGTNTAAGTFSTAVVVHDALGASHVLTINFTKTATNTWDYQITIPQADLAPRR